MNIGVLAFQGSFKEHVDAIKALGEEAVLVKDVEDLDKIDAIILPGGESTTIGKLLEITEMKKPLREKILKGLPIWGTCAGMILLAKEIENDRRRHLKVMDIKVKRNAFGRQIDSFKKEVIIEEISDRKIELVFIRAPYITEVSDKVKVLCEIEGHIVAARQANILVTSFHPELTKDLRVLKYFINQMVK